MTWLTEIVYYGQHCFKIVIYLGKDLTVVLGKFLLENHHNSSTYHGSIMAYFSVTPFSFSGMDPASTSDGLVFFIR